ncbi:MAG: arsinothricin resistance N-acetyltransferase ArsN1 family A [Candidatus Cybelea sp.]|jgi:phosphinothricin acetyltransferase
MENTGGKRQAPSVLRSDRAEPVFTRNSLLLRRSYGAGFKGTARLPVKQVPAVVEPIVIRRALGSDLELVRIIYNEGIEDRVATLDLNPRSPGDIAEWWTQHDERYAVIVATESDAVVGWASLNRFSHRCAHSSIADLSVYVARKHRGKGIGSALLHRLAEEARLSGFHKIVLHALNDNEHGKRLYRKAGFNEVGVFKEHGLLDERFVDVVAMERLLP